MTFTIAGKIYEIDEDRIVEVTRKVLPNPSDRRNKHYVRVHGRMYPIKQVIHLATELPYIAFTAQHAHRILERLGFEVSQVERPSEMPGNAVGQEGDRETVRFAVVLERDEDGYFLASCPALSGCHSQGRSRAEAISNIKEAIRGYIASMQKHGEKIPSAEVEEVEVAV